MAKDAQPGHAAIWWTIAVIGVLLEFRGCAARETERRVEELDKRLWRIERLIPPTVLPGEEESK